MVREDLDDERLGSVTWLISGTNHRYISVQYRMYLWFVPAQTMLHAMDVKHEDLSISSVFPSFSAPTSFIRHRASVPVGASPSERVICDTSSRAAATAAA